MSDALFPRDYITELFLGGRWVDVSQMVHQPSKVTIVRAAASEQGLAAPSSTKFTFYDPNDDLNPDNPLSPYFEQLGQNVPVRQRIGLVLDECTRVVSSSWGSVPVAGVPGGLPWSQLGGPATDFSVTGTKGRILLDFSGYHFTYLPGVVARNVRVDCPVFVNIGNVTGGPIEPGNVLLRGQSTDTYYMIRCEVTTAEVTTLAIYAVVAGVETALTGPVTAAGVTDINPKDLIVAGEIEDRTIRCKAYRPGLEGYGWHMTVHDTANRIPNAGWVGVRAGVGIGNDNTKPIAFDHDNVRITKTRFQGVIHKLAPRSDTTHKLKFVQAEGGGALRVLGRPEGAKRLDSAGRRFVPNQSYVKAFWPLEESFTAEVKGVGENAVQPTATTLVFERVPGSPPAGEIKWGQDATLPSIARAPQITNGGRLVATFPSSLLGSAGYSVAWGMRVSADAGAKVLLNTTTTQQWEGVFFAEGSVQFYRHPGAVPLFDYPYGADDAWHHYELIFDPSGGNSTVFLTVDGVAARVITVVGVALQPLIEARFSVPFATTGPLSVAHVALAAGLLNTFQQQDLAGAFYGWRGELAMNRFMRLCGEEGVPVVPSGDPAVTEPMGPQRPGLTLLEQLRECEAVNMGLLGEPLADGVKYRARQAVYAQPARVVLDYSGDTVVPDFQPDRGDRFILNDVTAERIGGAKFRRRVTTGPLSALPADQGGVGTYDANPKVNVRTDTQLPDQAEWRTHLGTNPDSRFPKLTIDLRAGGLTLAQQLAVLDLDALDRLTLTGLSPRKIFRDLDQLARGYTEVWGTTAEHRITFNTAPESGWHIGRASMGDRASGNASTLSAQLNSGALSMAVQSLPDETVPVTLWTTDAADFPQNVYVGGELITISAISGASSPQTFTISARNVNGLPVAGGKTHPVGTKVRIAKPVYAG